MQVALQIPRPLPSTRPAVCPALRVCISGNASATRTPSSRARCRDGSPCPADLVPVKMRAAPDGGTGIAKPCAKRAYAARQARRGSPGGIQHRGHIRHRGNVFDKRHPLRAPRKASFIHAKSAARSWAAPPTANNPAIAQAGRNPPNLRLPLSARRRKHSTSIDAPPEGPATSASPHKKRRPLPGSACFAICTFRHGALSSAPSPAPAWAWRSAPAPPARRASGGRRRRCLSWPRCRCTA